MTSDQQQRQKATVTTPAEREIHIVREFDAPRDRVFAVYTDPALIPEWWGPRGTTTLVDVMDVRPCAYPSGRSTRPVAAAERRPRRIQDSGIRASREGARVEERRRDSALPSFRGGRSASP